MLDTSEDLRVQHVERELQSRDPTIRIIFNPKCGVAEPIPFRHRRPRPRWVVVQQLPADDYRPTEWELVGTPGIGSRSNMKAMFVCETHEDVPLGHQSRNQPIKPGMWIWPVLQKLCPRSMDCEAWDNVKRKAEVNEAKAESRAMDELKQRESDALSFGTKTRVFYGS